MSYKNDFKWFSVSERLIFLVIETYSVKWFKNCLESSDVHENYSSFASHGKWSTSPSFAKFCCLSYSWINSARSSYHRRTSSTASAFRSWHDQARHALLPPQDRHHRPRVSTWNLLRFRSKSYRTDARTHVSRIFTDWWSFEEDEKVSEQNISQVVMMYDLRRTFSGRLEETQNREQTFDVRLEINSRSRSTTFAAFSLASRVVHSKCISSNLSQHFNGTTGSGSSARHDFISVATIHITLFTSSSPSSQILLRYKFWEFICIIRLGSFFESASRMKTRCERPGTLKIPSVSKRFCTRKYDKRSQRVAEVNRYHPRTTP